MCKQIRTVNFCAHISHSLHPCATAKTHNIDPPRCPLYESFPRRADHECEACLAADAAEEKRDREEAGKGEARVKERACLGAWGWGWAW